MNDFKPKEKQILWFTLLLTQSIAMLYRFNISFQLLINSVVIVALGALYSIHISKGKRVNIDNSGNEIISTDKAILFPFMASGALLFIYVLLNHIDNKVIILLFKIKFAVLGIGLIGDFMAPRIHFIFPSTINATIINKSIIICSHIINIDITTYKMIAYTIATTISTMYITNGHWTLNNMLAIAIAIRTISTVRISKFSTTFILLFLLLVYDIVWVFGTDVMMIVAHKFDVPIKLLLPVSVGRLTIIGLGDMIIPGLLCVMALKFDVDVALEKGNENTDDVRTPLFYSVLGGYGVGIVLAFFGMSIMNQAQPALLYLVPCCSLGLLYGAFLEDKLKRLCNYEAETIPLIKN